MKNNNYSFNSVLKIEKEQLSADFKAFEYIIKNYCQLKVLLNFNSNEDLQEYLEINLDNESQRDHITIERLEFVKYGEIHLGFLLSYLPQCYLIISVFKSVIQGLTIREISAAYRCSVHTVMACRFIAANELAKYFSKNNVFKREQKV